MHTWNTKFIWNPESDMNKSQTWKMERPLGSPKTLLTPLWSTILVALSKFLPNKKCKLNFDRNRHYWNKIFSFSQKGLTKNLKWDATNMESWSSVTVPFQPFQLGPSHQCRHYIYQKWKQRLCLLSGKYSKTKKKNNKTKNKQIRKRKEGK